MIYAINSPKNHEKNRKVVIEPNANKKLMMHNFLKTLNIKFGIKDLSLGLEECCQCDQNYFIRSIGLTKSYGGGISFNLGSST